MLIALASLASASTVVHDHGLIQQDLEQGLLEPGDALFLRFQQHFEPEGLPTRYAVEIDEGWSCGTGLVMELIEHWDSLEGWQQDRIDELLVPWGGTLTDPMGEPLETLDEVPPPAASETCFGGTYGDYQLATEHFMIEYESGVSESNAKKLGEAMEVGYDAMVTEHGWTDVIKNDDYLLLVYISNDSGSGAYTWYESCQRGGWMPYIVTYENTLSGSWYKSMAPHEYNHAQQMTYGWSHEFWYWEATATYIEELVVPSLNGWDTYIQYGYSEQPHISMRASDQQDDQEFWHMYGMAVWPFYLDEHVGGQELVRETWENAGQGGGTYNYEPWDVLDDVGVDFWETYRGFIAANTVFDYAEGGSMGKVTLVDTVSSLPASGDITSNKRPETLGQNFLKFKPGALGDASDLEVTFTGESGGEFIALLVATNDDEVVETVELELEGELGTGVVEGAADYDAVYLVVSPTKGKQSRYDWSWSAQGLSPEPIDTGGPDVPGGDNQGNRKPGIHAGGCGCASSTGGGALGLGLLLAGLALLRRRA